MHVMCSGRLQTKSLTPCRRRSRLAVALIQATYHQLWHGCNMWQGLESLLHKMRVRVLVLPSVVARVPMWKRKFGFECLSTAECAAIDERIVYPDPDSVQLLKKSVYK